MLICTSGRPRRSASKTLRPLLNVALFSDGNRSGGKLSVLGTPSLRSTVDGDVLRFFAARATTLGGRLATVGSSTTGLRSPGSI